MTLTPKVIDKTLQKMRFNPKIIYNSLLAETDLNEEQAKIIAEDTTRCVIAISANIKNITAPMIREIANSMMLKHGFEKERLQYTRIGFPVYDLLKIREKETQGFFGKEQEIVDHVIREFYNVLNLMNKVGQNGELNGEE